MNEIDDLYQFIDYIEETHDYKNMFQFTNCHKLQLAIINDVLEFLKYSNKKYYLSNELALQAHVNETIGNNISDPRMQTNTICIVTSLHTMMVNQLYELIKLKYEKCAENVKIKKENDKHIIKMKNEKYDFEIVTIKYIDNFNSNEMHKYHQLNVHSKVSLFKLHPSYNEIYTDIISNF